jgi:hypothetical protein
MWPLPSMVVPMAWRMKPSVERKVVLDQPTTAGRPGLVETMTQYSQSDGHWPALRMWYLLSGAQ